MMNIEDIKKELQKMISPKRFNHSVNVMKAAEVLAQKYGEDPEKAAIAGLVHDCAKGLDGDEILKMCKRYGIVTDSVMLKHPELLHGPVGAFIAREVFGIDCPRILAAIEDHTMGRPGMDRLSSIVFVADYISEDRKCPGVDLIRKAADESLEKAIVAGIDNTIRYILDKGYTLHPKTVETRNWALERLEAQNSRHN